MHERFGGSDADLPAAPGCHDLMMLAPNPLAVLTDVREQGPFLLVQDRRDVDIGIGEEPFSLTAGVDFEEVEQRGARASRHPGANREYARDLTIHRRLDRPVCGEHV